MSGTGPGRRIPARGDPAGEGRARGRDRAAAQPAPLSVAVMLADEGEAGQLVRDLQRTRAQVRRHDLSDEVPEQADILFCQLTADLPRRLPWLPGAPPMALVVVLPGAGGPLPLQVLRNCAPHGVLQLPCSEVLAEAVLHMAHEQFLYAGRMQRRIEKLDDNLRTIRNVERAKAILISSRRLSEEEAYGFLRRKAMERRISIGALASLIVDSEDLLP